MKHIKFLLIIMLILNLIISIILGIESEHIREELVNIKLAEEVEDFSKKTENITYITNGNAFNSKYGGNMTSTELSKKISDFMTGTVPQIATETKNMTSQEELKQYYTEKSMRKLTGIKDQDINEFYSLVNEIKKLGETNLEFESAEYDENSIKEKKGSSLSAVLMIKYKNVEQTLDCYITASYSSAYVTFLPNSSN